MVLLRRRGQPRAAPLGYHRSLWQPGHLRRHHHGLPLWSGRACLPVQRLRLQSNATVCYDPGQHADMLVHRNIDLVSKTPMPVSTCIEGLCLSTFIQSFTPIIGSILDHFHGCISLPACLHDSSGVKGEEESNDVRFGGCSFTATTPVTTAQGKQPIGKLKPGEKVWAYNPRTHKM